MAAFRRAGSENNGTCKGEEPRGLVLDLGLDLNSVSSKYLWWNDVSVWL